MDLYEIRKAYDANYREMVKVIAQMGGDEFIVENREENSPLYRQLKELQQREHYLDKLENRCYNHGTVIRRNRPQALQPNLKENTITV